MKKRPTPEVHVITTLAPTANPAKRRYLLLMLLRVALVPGVVLLSLPVWVQVTVILIAALSQLTAVIDVNTPKPRPPRAYNEKELPGKVIPTSTEGSSARSAV